MTAKIHEFRSTGQAYDALQCDDTIRNGDVLVVRSERVIGIALEAWPVAITPEHGAFHTLADPTDDWSDMQQGAGTKPPRDYRPDVSIARELAAELGFLNPAPALVEEG